MMWEAFTELSPGCSWHFYLLLIKSNRFFFSGELWGTDEFFSSFSVYALTTSGVEKTCSVVFRNACPYEVSSNKCMHIPRNKYILL